MAEDTRPLCKCHGEPMHRNGQAKRAGFRCAIRKRASAREIHWNAGGRERKFRIYAERKAAGLCTRCGKPSLTTTACWSCLNDQAERDALRI